MCCMFMLSVYQDLIPQLDLPVPLPTTAVLQNLLQEIYFVVESAHKLIHMVFSSLFHEQSYLADLNNEKDIV